MRRMPPLHLNSCRETDDGTGGTEGLGKRHGLVIMGFRVFILICLLLLANAQKWPVNGDCRPCQCYYKMTNFGRLRSVNCSQRGLKVIPPNLPSDLMFLDLSWNPLDEKQLSQSVCKFRSLQSLMLSFTDLTYLSEILKGCSSVLELNLTGNRLNQVDFKTFQGLENLRRLLGLEVDAVLTRDVFKQLTSLKDLDLLYHGKSLPDGLFDGMVLQNLNLVLTQATSLPQGVFHFGQKTLNTLQLVGERVTTLPAELLNSLSVLRKLYLTMPSVDNIPESFFHGLPTSKQLETPANLQELEISGIKSLPPGLFNRLSNLETLQLKEIDSFPQVGFLAEVINLRMLVITGSKLERIPAKWFEELYSLKTLRLSGDQLQELDDDAFIGLLNLNNLDLSYNNLEHVTGTMLKPLNQTLQSLVLSSNYISEISKDCMSRLRSLRFLDISENRLTNVYADSFEGMNWLSVLYLQNNRLTSLPKDLFKNQLQLESLSVADNYLVEFPEAILKLKSSLVSLDLSSNGIRQVPAFELCQFTYLETINIMGNSLHCDCRMLAFHRCPKIAVEAQCITPREYLDKYLKDIEIPRMCIGYTPKQSTPQVGLYLTTTNPNTALTKLGITSENLRSSNSTVVRKLFPQELESDGFPEHDLAKELNTGENTGQADDESKTLSTERSFKPASENQAPKTGSKDQDTSNKNGSKPSRAEDEEQSNGEVEQVSDTTRLPKPESVEKGVMMKDAPIHSDETNRASSPKSTPLPGNDESKGPALSNSAPDSATVPDKEPGEGRGAFIESTPAVRKPSPVPSSNLSDLPPITSDHDFVFLDKTEQMKNKTSKSPSSNTKNIIFNFTISAFVALFVFGCAIVTVFCVRRWQQKGAYVVANSSCRDTEMNTPECGAGEKICAQLENDPNSFPMAKCTHKK